MSIHVPGTAAGSRRTELAAFLRSRRERITPEAVGLPPGPRRRTPGLRREEVAQLAGVGVTWYTWLEQGRPINASVQVLDAIARTLKLDTAEREHLYRLADMPEVPRSAECGALEPEVRTILTGLTPLPACVYNARYDLLAWNDAYGALFPVMVGGKLPVRNALWALFTSPDCCNEANNRAEELPWMVATLRAGFARHVGEPAWTDFVRKLSAVSPEFARMWAMHDVAQPGRRTKIYENTVVGTLRLTSTSLDLTTPPETRVVVYTPIDEATADRIAWLLDHPEEARRAHEH